MGAHSQVELVGVAVVLAPLVELDALAEVVEVADVEDEPEAVLLAEAELAEAELAEAEEAEAEEAELALALALLLMLPVPWYVKGTLKLFSLGLPLSVILKL